MSAQIVVLAEVRAARAEVTVRVSFDPMAAWRAWFRYWYEPRQAGEVREFVSQKCLNG